MGSGQIPRDKGNTGEEEASAYLRELGYSIEVRNFRTRCGEIDIVATKDGAIHFIEVKAWQVLSVDSLGESITDWKRYKLRRTAQAFLTANPNFFDYSIQFDVLFLDKLNSTIDFIEDV